MQAITVAVGCSAAISRARFGPDTTAIWSAGAPVTSPITSLIRLALPSSTPFIRLISVASGASSGVHSARLARRSCDGIASATSSAPLSAIAGSCVARSDVGSVAPGR